ncbi:MAG TPA: hypothetical protein VK249_09735, partial [Anaerolineales bacterium]|nr:hypothetical protein [Anaerolineales bacterium]
RGYCYIDGAYRECLIIEASSVTQSAVVQILGSLYMQAVPFRNIANVALKYDSGEVVQNFGAPRLSNPASLEYISNFENASAED